MNNDELRMTNEGAPSVHNNEIIRKTHKMIKAITEDIERFSFNTAIAKLMEFTNYLYEIKKSSKISNSSLVISNFLIMLSPFAPHIADELWHQLGNKESICKQSWPTYDPVLIIETEVTIAVQVNGKLRDTIVVPADAAEEQIRAKALASDKVKHFIEGKQVIKLIVVPGKLVNIVVK